MSCCSITDEEIYAMDAQSLLSQDTLYSIYDNNEAEIARISAVAETRAQELGIQKQMAAVIKAFNAANKKLASEYSKSCAMKHASIQLEFDGNGRPLSTIDNFLRVLENDEKFANIKFNLLTYSPEQVRHGKTLKWTDADDADARCYIEQKYHFHNAQKLDDALRIIFVKNKYNPIVEMIDGIQWDGEPRIKNFLHKWTHCEDTPYTQEVSRLIFSGGINRIYNPGCKFDDMPVLIGTKQGEGKSTLVRWLAMKDEYFTEVNEFEGQRGIEAIEGAWICEVSELLAMTRTKEQEAVKSYLTRLNDRYRMPFDKRTTDHPRQCIFIGTTNKEQFLTDKTGNRRFYPVKITQSGYDLFDHEAECREYTRQCWGEARVLYLCRNMQPYADRSLLTEIRNAQSQAVEDDYRVGMIEEYLLTRTETCIYDIWVNALHNVYDKPTKKDSNEIGLILQSFPNWEKQPAPKRFQDFGVQRWWKNMQVLCKKWVNDE